MKLSIIIPVYNEVNLVVHVIEKLLELDYSDYTSSFEIIAVDDCSSDNTLQKLNDFAKGKEEMIKVLHHEKNQGKGAAVRTGIIASEGELITIQDADLELNPEDIISMLKARHRLGVNVVNGSRYMPGKIRPLYAYKRYFFNKMFTRLASILVNVRFTDLACGYKLFTRKMYDRLNLKEDRFGFEAELLIKMARLEKTTVAEVPVDYFPRNEGEGKKLRNSDGIKIFWVIIKYGLFRAK